MLFCFLFFPPSLFYAVLKATIKRGKHALFQKPINMRYFSRITAFKFMSLQTLNSSACSMKNSKKKNQNEERKYKMESTPHTARRQHNVNVGSKLTSLKFLFVIRVTDSISFSSCLDAQRNNRVKGWEKSFLEVDYKKQLKRNSARSPLISFPIYSRGI